jgi:hypothetical protein
MPKQKRKRPIHPMTLSPDVSKAAREALKQIHFGWVSHGSAMPGGEDRNRRSYETKIGLSELTERLLADFAEAVDVWDTGDGPAPEKGTIGASLFPPPSRD